VLVSRKIQHTAELDCRQRGLRLPDGRNPFAETATFLSIISLQEGRLIAEPRIAVKIRCLVPSAGQKFEILARALAPARAFALSGQGHGQGHRHGNTISSVDPVHRRRIDRFQPSIGRHFQDRAAGHRILRFDLRI
jgi:hypothetical protein